MAALQQPTNRSSSRERGPSNNYSIRSAADSERRSVINGGSIRSADENRLPPAMPKALQGMLKSTTETGDIGLFSIKPSRVPHLVNNPRRMSGPYNDDGMMQRPRQFQPYGVPSIDDRRRLPSYARDASSEVISMYETDSQKSASRAFEDPDYRSYSMTQTYSSYSLSNHRSYTSLRSQPEAGGLLQRPRSPFAYPTRLKRPGFRPSSPALTDGGAIDYSRRAEIDRLPHGANHHTSSPASLYAQKRKPPLSLRPEANRSTPSLLSQSSPQRRSPSLRTRHRSATPSNDYHKRNGPASINTSPARSTFSLASTVNLYQAPPAPSTTTTPGKVPPSPLYYDYTEDFEIDEYNQPEVLEPAPQFRIEKTIPEDRPLSSDLATLDGSDLRGQKSGLANGFRNSSSATSVLKKSLEFFQDSSINSRSTSIFGPIQRHPDQDVAVAGATSSEEPAVNPRDMKIIRFSGLGLRARELSTHVEEAFGLPPSPSFEILVSDNAVDQRTPNNATDIPQENENETQSVRTSSYSLNTHLGQFPPPPRNLDGQCSDDSDDIVTLPPGQLNTSTSLPLGRQDYPTESSLHAGGNTRGVPDSEQNHTDDVIGNFPPRSSSLHSDRERLSRPYPGEANLAELDELIKTFEDASKPKILVEKQSLQESSKVFPAIRSTLADGSLFVHSNLSQRFSPPSSSFNRLNGDIGFRGLQDQGLKRGHLRNKPRRLEAMTAPIESENDIPNFSHQFPRKLISRSESPMLAPKPISPARQLKLKNSVPQLMKALPPLPPDPSVVAVSPPVQLAFSDIELPCRFSPLIPKTNATHSQEPPRPADIRSSEDIDADVLSEKTEEPVELGSVPVSVIMEERVAEERKVPTPPPPKLKLKMRSASTLRPTSPPESRPWNSADSYPWSSQSFNVGLPPVIQEGKAPNPKPPKFRLKITRASNSTVGTVRINRESVESKPLAGLHLRHNKDLFTPNSGIDNIFRQVSRHLHSRKASASSTHNSDEIRPEPLLASISDRLSPSRSLSSDLSIPHESPSSLHAKSPTEIRSFFSDDSSHLHRGGRGLRKRLSNLRARIAVPYGATNGTQSDDDITWRDRNGPEAPVPVFSRSIPNIHEGRASTEARPPRRLAERIHAHKLRARFTVWFKGARSAIRARVKSRKATGRGDDEQLQLTGAV